MYGADGLSRAISATRSAGSPPAPGASVRSTPAGRWHHHPRTHLLKLRSVLASAAWRLVWVLALLPGFVALFANSDTDMPAALAFLVNAPGRETAPLIQFLPAMATSLS